MSCARAREIDVEAFLIDSSGDAFADFRAHYPGCADCSAAVADWLALDLALRDVVATDEGVAREHPAADRLAAYARADDSRRAELADVGAHAAGCPACRTEIAALRRFDPAALAERFGVVASPAATEAVASDVGDTASSAWLAARDRLSGWLESLFAPGLSGGFAPVAVVLLLALGIAWWASRGGLAPESPSGDAPVDYVERDAPPAPESAPGSVLPPGSAPAPAPAPSPERTEQLARTDPAPPAPAPPALPDPRPGGEPASTPLAHAEPEASAPHPGDDRPFAPSAPPAPSDSPLDGPGESEVVLLAALDAMPPARYAASRGGAGLEWLVEVGTSRSEGEGVRVETLAPRDHVGLTLEASPRLWWRLSEPTDATIQITVTDEDAIEPLVRVERRGPHAAGLHALDLSAHGTQLAVGAEYRWYVRVLVDAERVSRNPVAVGAIARVPAEDPRAAEVSEVAPAGRGHRFAELGLWYDAYDYFASLAKAHPERASLAERRDQVEAQLAE